jgi:hypothetical protein
VEGKGDGEGIVRRLSAGSLSSRGVEESSSYFFHDGVDPLRREAVGEGDISESLEYSIRVLSRAEVPLTLFFQELVVQEEYLE